MSDFLGYLIARSYDRAEVVQPRPMSLFEPSPETGSIPFYSDVDGEEDQPPGVAEHPPVQATVHPPPSPWPPPSEQNPTPSTPEVEMIPQPVLPPPPLLHVVEKTDVRAPLAPTNPVQPPVAPAPVPFDTQPRERAQEPDLPPPPATPLRPSETTPAPMLPGPPHAEPLQRLTPEPPPLARPPAVHTAENEPLLPRNARPAAAQPEEPKATRRPVFEPVTRKAVLEPATQQIVIERIVETVKQPVEAKPQAPLRREEGDRRARYEPLLPRSEPEFPSQDPVALRPRLPDGWDRLAAETPTVAEPPPTIQVTIGRVEVRATTTSALEKKKPRPQPVVMSLDDYLKQRAQGGSP